MRCVALRRWSAALAFVLFSTWALSSLAVTLPGVYETKAAALAAADAADHSRGCELGRYCSSACDVDGRCYVDDSFNNTLPAVRVYFSSSGACPQGESADSSGLCSSGSSCDKSTHQLVFHDEQKFHDADNDAMQNGVTLPSGKSYSWDWAMSGTQKDGSFWGAIYVTQDCADTSKNGTAFPTGTVSDQSDASQCHTNQNGNSVCSSAKAAQANASKCPGAYGTVNGSAVCVDAMPKKADQCATSSDGAKACYGDQPTLYNGNGQQVYPDFSAQKPAEGSATPGADSAGGQTAGQSTMVYAPKTANSVVLQSGNGADFGVAGSPSASGSGGSGDGSPSEGGNGTTGNTMSGCTPGASGCPLKIDGSPLKGMKDNGDRYSSVSNEMTNELASQIRDDALPSSMPTGKGFIDRVKAMIPSGGSCSSLSIEITKGQTFTLPGAIGCKILGSVKAVLGWFFGVLAILEIQQIFFASARRD